jgi:hypothetical protein
MDGKRAANGSHADEPDHKKAKTETAAKPALNLVCLLEDVNIGQFHPSTSSGDQEVP